MDRPSEDRKDWPKDTALFLECRACGNEIVKWHCEERGCSWCRACGKANEA